MSALLDHGMLLFAAEMFVISAIVLALAWEAAHLFRKRAALRHLVWLGAFAALLVLPLLAAVLPSQVHVMLAAPALPQQAMPASEAEVMPAMVASVPAQALAAPQISAFRLDIGFAARVLAMLWCAGILLLALRGIFAILSLRALKRQSRAHCFGGIPLPEGRYEVRIGRRPNDFGPVTWGILRPVILLPFQAQFWPRERIAAVLMHEVAHIRRRDSLSQLLSTIVCAVYWPNPLVWIAARNLRAEAEMAADDTVLASGIRASSYAGELLQLACEYRSREPALAGMPLFMAGSALEARVKSVLAATPQRSGVTKMDVLKIGGAVVLAAAALSFARPTLAQEETPSPDRSPAVTAAPLPPPAGPAAQPASPAAASPVSPAARVMPPPPVQAAAAAEADPAPPAPVAAPLMRVQPVVNVRSTERTQHGRTVRHIVIDTDVTAPSPEEKAQIHAAIARAEAEVRVNEADLRKIEEVRRRADAVNAVQEDKIRFLQAHLPEIQARIDAEMAKVQPEIARAIAAGRDANIDVKIRESVDKAMKPVTVHIQIVKDKATADEGAALAQ